MSQTLSTMNPLTGWQFDLDGIPVQHVTSLVCVNKSVTHILHSNLPMFIMVLSHQVSSTSYWNNWTAYQLEVDRRSYNLGQYKMEQLSPIPPPQSNDEGAKEQETRHFGIIEMGGGVVQMFRLFCPRL